jgi:hypothetical protein
MPPVLLAPGVGFCVVLAPALPATPPVVVELADDPLKGGVVGGVELGELLG